MKAIETRALRKTYDGKNVVDDLNLEVREGELFSLLGMNGAGKTTTIRMLCGILCPDGGDAQLLGRSIRTQMREIKPLISVSPQESAVAPKLTVRENLEFIAEIYGFSRSEARKKAEGMIDEFELEAVVNKPAGKLSGGWQRRLSIAMALISDPKIIFLDEPTLGLDVLARREFWNLLRKLRGRITILMTTHYLEEAEVLSDRIGIMRDGCLTAAGSAAELIALAGSKNFEDAFVALAGGEI